MSRASKKRAQRARRVRRALDREMDRVVLKLVKGVVVRSRPSQTSTETFATPLANRSVWIRRES